MKFEMLQLNLKHMIVGLIIAHNNGSYSLLVHASYFISSSVHTILRLLLLSFANGVGSAAIF